MAPLVHPNPRRPAGRAAAFAYPAKLKAAARKLVTHVGRQLEPGPGVVDLTVAEPGDSGLYVCALCPPEAARAFRCYKGLATHRMRAHGVRKLAAAFILPNSATCPACGRDYGSHRASLDHLECRSKACRAAMVEGRLPPIPGMSVASVLEFGAAPADRAAPVA